jgi:hypothetical protein
LEHIALLEGKIDRSGSFSCQDIIIKFDLTISLEIILLTIVQQPFFKLLNIRVGNLRQKLRIDE